jgi:hypothetical protein
MGIIERGDKPRSNRHTIQSALAPSQTPDRACVHHGGGLQPQIITLATALRGQVIIGATIVIERPSGAGADEECSRRRTSRTGPPEENVTGQWCYMWRIFLLILFLSTPSTFGGNIKGCCVTVAEWNLYVVADMFTPQKVSLFDVCTFCFCFGLNHGRPY